MAVGALLTQLALEIIRGRLLLAAGAKLERLGPVVLEGTLRQALTATGGDAASLSDVAQLRNFLSGGTLTRCSMRRGRRCIWGHRAGESVWRHRRWRRACCWRLGLFKNERLTRAPLRETINMPAPPATSPTGGA